jgi:hypothetical protein
MEGAPAPEKRLTMSDFQFIKVLGRGSFGKVVLCREKVSQVGIDQVTTKTPNPKFRLYWYLIEFIDWRYSQACWYFRSLL